ncbi:hypothetical protein GJA_89 [Janthinobacterium agaricidamnosum NBRC 102515 = DSM 9628]|uniref:Uncharacterized protein n=1 Tax=Janthinobacterium agaricidamnosum NBRC 102515 = DSM 9628 TaxID=1349767 RepID=W0V0E7_9BURK|nr:hypothetical protein GJA_89 [Janthinobacterium agaricidamnosum NBRC 102515 = DSM 9628]
MRQILQEKRRLFKLPGSFDEENPGRLLYAPGRDDFVAMQTSRQRHEII